MLVAILSYTAIALLVAGLIAGLCFKRPRLAKIINMFASPCRAASYILQGNYIWAAIFIASSLFNIYSLFNKGI